MTPELIKQWAAKAGAAKFVHEREGNLVTDESNLLVSVAMFERFAALVAAHQRELDARICESEDLLWVDGKPTADAFAAAIRGRGE